MVETKEMEPLLLVEDKPELRAMLRKALERAGYAVDEAPDGAAAIQKIRARRYLLVITDLKMPGASGLDVLRETKQADAAIPVLLLTAYGSMEKAEQEKNCSRWRFTTFRRGGGSRLWR